MALACSPSLLISELELPQAQGSPTDLLLLLLLRPSAFRLLAQA
jgi:hypothetical protein